jgi:hypothetical protein
MDIRRFLPRKADLRHYSPRQIEAIARRCNGTPRKCLGFQTPAELFSSHLLHFGCESTSIQPPGCPHLATDRARIGPLPRPLQGSLGDLFKIERQAGTSYERRSFQILIAFKVGLKEVYERKI